MLQLGNCSFICLAILNRW